MRALGVLKNWIDSGYLPAIRIGRRVRVKQSDFDALVEASYTGPRTPSEAIWSGDSEDLPGPEVPSD